MNGVFGDIQWKRIVQNDQGEQGCCMSQSGSNVPMSVGRTLATH